MIHSENKPVKEVEPVNEVKIVKKEKKIKPVTSDKKEIINITTEAIPEKEETKNIKTVVESEKPDIKENITDVPKKKISPKKGKKQDNSGILDLFSQMDLDLD